MARVLVLRAAAEAESTGAALAARGHVPLLLPLQAIETLETPLPDGRFAALLVTSANAVPALARQPQLRAHRGERLLMVDHQIVSSCRLLLLCLVLLLLLLLRDCSQIVQWVTLGHRERMLLSKLIVKIHHLRRRRFELLLRKLTLLFACSEQVKRQRLLLLLL